MHRTDKKHATAEAIAFQHDHQSTTKTDTAWTHVGSALIQGPIDSYAGLHTKDSILLYVGRLDPSHCQSAAIG